MFNEMIEVTELVEIELVRDHRGSGHVIDEETKRELKKRAVRIYGEQIMSKKQLADRLGISKCTLWRWEYKDGDAEFADGMKEAQASQDEQRVDAIESRFTTRLIEGKAHPIEYIFYLTNRAPDRWKDKRALFQQKIQVAETNVCYASPIREMVKKWTPEKRAKFLQIVSRMEGELGEFEQNAEEAGAEGANGQ